MVELVISTVDAIVKLALSIPEPSPIILLRIIISPQLRFCRVMPAPYARTFVKLIVPTVLVVDPVIMIRSKVPSVTAGIDTLPLELP